MRDSWVDGDCGRLAVRSWSGPSRPIVLLHQARSSLESWQGIPAQLAALGHAVVAYDARSHGHSYGCEDLSFAGQARDLAAIVDALELADPILVGHSMGGYVGLEYLVAYDNGSLISLDGPVGDLAARIAAGQPPPDFAAEEASLAADDFDGTAAEFEAALTGMIARSAGTSESSWRRVHRVRESRAVRRPRPQEAAQILRFVHEQPSTSLLMQVRRPTLLALAARPEPDTERGRARLAARQAVAARIANPRVEVRWLPTGHQAIAEAPEVVLSLIVDFASRSGAKNESGP